MPRKVKSKALVLAPAPSTVPQIFQERPDLQDAVRDYAGAADATNTLRARRADLRVFSVWCEENHCDPLAATPAVVAAFLADQSKGGEGRAPKSVATVGRYACSIGVDYKLRGFQSPVDDAAVKKVLRGIRRERGVAPHKKTAFTEEIVLRVIKPLPPEATKKRVRDRALVLFGLASAMRRSEIVALDVEDLNFTEQGIIVRVRKSKTDQEGKGRVAAVQRFEIEDICPVRAIRRWLEVSGITSGPLFRGQRGNRLTDRQVALAVKFEIGDEPGDFAAHSLRAGYVSTAKRNGVDWGAIMAQTGHKKVETAKGYTQFTPEVFEETRAQDVFRSALKIKESKKK